LTEEGYLSDNVVRVAVAWYIRLNTNKCCQGAFGSSYQRPRDDKTIRVTLHNQDLTLNCFATHEICLIPSEAVYVPFVLMSDKKNYNRLWSAKELMANQGASGTSLSWVEYPVLHFWGNVWQFVRFQVE
jgi:hypothetical protein